MLGATHRVDALVTVFLSSLARYAVLAVVGVAVLQLFGIQTASLVAVLGATSLAIGPALQGTLSNLAAGVMLLLFRPFRIGDDVEVAGKGRQGAGLVAVHERADHIRQRPDPAVPTDRFGEARSSITPPIPARAR